MYPMSPSAPWRVELSRALPSLVNSGTAVFGVAIAKAGLAKWRRETMSKQKVELARDARFRNNQSHSLCAILPS